jgi:hypothetical protein
VAEVEGRDQQDDHDWKDEDELDHALAALALSMAVHRPRTTL